MKIVLLPGMDGTGYLLKKLVERFPDDLDVHIVSLNELAGDSFTQQAISLNQQFVNSPLFIIAESYSGRIAYEYCRLFERQVITVVLLASFISPPNFISRHAFLIPLFLFKPNPITKFLMNYLGFNGNGTKQQVDNVFASITAGDTSKLRRRLKNISTLEIPKEVTKVPVIYIRPKKDLLVSDKAFNVVKTIFSDFKKVDVNGGHFVAQMYPSQCVNVILLTVEDLKSKN